MATLYLAQQSKLFFCKTRRAPAVLCYSPQQLPARPSKYYLFQFLYKQKWPLISSNVPGHQLYVISYHVDRIHLPL